MMIHRSLRRLMPGCKIPEQNLVVTKVLQMFSNYGDIEEMVRLSAYRARRDERADTAVNYFCSLDTFLAQDRIDRSDPASGYAELAQI